MLINAEFYDLDEGAPYSPLNAMTDPYSRRQTENATSGCKAGNAVARYQLATSPNVMMFSNGSKHKGTKSKKCKRKQNNKGGRK